MGVAEALVDVAGIKGTVMINVPVLVGFVLSILSAVAGACTAIIACAVWSGGRSLRAQAELRMRGLFLGVSGVVLGVSGFLLCRLGA